MKLTLPGILNGKTLVATALLAMVSVAHAEQNFQRTLSVPAAPSLSVVTGSGEIRVHPGPAGQIQIVGHVHPGWMAFGDVQERVRQILAHPPIEQAGGTVRVGQNLPHGMLDNISIDYDITAPAASTLSLRSGSGNIDTDHIGTSLDAVTGSGDLRIHGLGGPAHLQTGSGSISLESLAPGNVEARTGSGDIRLSDVRGSIQARSGSGNVEVQGALTGASMLGSGSGDLRVHVGAAAHLQLEASTGSGDIRLHLPDAPQQDPRARHHVTAAIHGGGPPLEMHTGSGNITVD